MQITRHFAKLGNRRVHYRLCGNGPPLLMIHQSPRSSAEYEGLMREWGAHFTCIAPDSPGFGQSDPLPDATADIDDFADALVDLLDSLGLERVAAYGFHSGGIILVTALRRHPERFTALAVGGYAIWTPQEQALFAGGYLPPFRPTAYGEHLTWLWNRVLEQTWFFPWFSVAPEFRMSVAHDDPIKVDATVRDFLDSGDAYRVGYGAVLRASRDIPPPDTVTPPVLITAYNGDPLQAHLDRLGEMPASWSARPVATPAEHQAASLAFLREYPAPLPAQLGETADQGFAHIVAGGFDGLIHWRGIGGDTLHVHAPGRAAALMDTTDGLAIDLPGHGLSDDWDGPAPTDRAQWNAVIDAVAARFGCTRIAHEPAPQGDPARLFPDLTPDRFGAYLTRAWSIVRAAHFFDPWYEGRAASAVPFSPDAVMPDALAREHRALLRSGTGAALNYLIALQAREGEI